MSDEGGPSMTDEVKEDAPDAPDAPDTPGTQDNSPTSDQKAHPAWQWQPGISGNPKGRPKGPNKATREAKIACGLIVDDPEYREILLLRARAGMLPPAVEVMLWHYAKGKPTDKLHITGFSRNYSAANLHDLTAEELAAKAEEIAARIRAQSGLGREAAEALVRRRILAREAELRAQAGHPNPRPLLPPAAAEGDDEE